MSGTKYDLIAYMDLAGIDNLDSVSMPILEYLYSYFSKKSNLLHGMKPVRVRYQEFAKNGPRYEFNFMGTMEADRNGFPEYDFDDFKAQVKMALEDYKGEPLFVDGEPLTHEQQGLLADDMYLDMNTPFPEITVSEMVDGILSGKYLTEKAFDGKAIFRECGLYPDEVVNTIQIASALLGDKNPAVSQELLKVSKMLSKMWNV